MSGLSERLFVAEAQALHGARPVILDDDVGIADQTPYDLFLSERRSTPRLRWLRPLRRKKTLTPFRYASSPRPVSLPGPFGGFDLHDVGPEVGQDLDGGGALQEVCEAKDLNPVQHHLSGPFREKAGKPRRINPHTFASSSVSELRQNAARVSRRRPGSPLRSPPS